MPDILNLSEQKIYVAGHGGMVGSAIARALKLRGITPLVAKRSEVDLERQQAVEDWFAGHRPDIVVVAAAQVGGIHANHTYPRDFIYRNLMIAANLIEASHRSGVRKLLFLGSSCIYPRDAPQPSVEDVLLTAPLEPSNEWYAVAKIAGIKLAQSYRRQFGDDYISLMPTNLYGPGDNYHPEDSHVVAALIGRFHRAKESGQSEVVVWGTGTPRREFLFVDDLADASLFVLERYSAEQHLNVGTGIDLTIAEVAREIASVVGYRGAIRFDASKPDGTPRKLLDVGRMSALGWTASTPFRDGLERAYADFLAGGGRMAATRDTPT